MPDPAWRREGEEPDYRFSLANERTFLAWIRTALALMAGAVGFDQLAPGLAPAPVRTALGVVLALGGAVLGATAYRRWARNEQAMRKSAPLPHTRLLIALTVGTAGIAAAFCLLILVDS
ncbi:DUF202 domain-containing protein [Streptomyces sp. NPDC005202]|uniref:YidH family protein n=1 Tax=Streptomyces sp. NPDC005202 TaxID=3157021 RepID=UPI00339FF3DC